MTTTRGTTHVVALTVAGAVTATVVFALVLRSLDGVLGHVFIPSIVGAPAAVPIGTLIAIRRPRQPIGWLLLAIALTQGTSEAAGAYAYHSVVLHPGTWPVGALAAWVGAFMWMPGAFLNVTLVLLLFPTGRLPSARWRPVAALAVAGLSLVVFASAYSAWGRAPAPDAFVLPPGGLPLATGMLALAVCTVLSVLSLFMRYRRSDSDERHQLKWVLFATLLLVVVFAMTLMSTLLHLTILAVTPYMLAVAVVSFPTSIGVAILRYRLYDIDTVINRALVYGSLAALITGVYVGIAVGIGELAGSGGKPNLGLSILATAIVAVGFQPARERLQRIANRLVYGERATPYQVLSEFSSNVAGAYAPEDVLQRMARVLQEGTGAESSTVWLHSGDALHPAALYPERASLEMRSVPVNGSLPPLPDATRAVEVRHQGELLGALSVLKRRGESLTPVEEKLLTDLAHQAGLVLKNVRLTADLQRRLEELRISRQRLVSAQDEERRRLERNLHDGAQQHLVALKVKLGIAEMLAAKDPDKAKATLQQLKADTDEALETLRDLARGIYPPLLAEKGLVTALESQARKATLPVTVEADGLGRYPLEVEATVYFCVLEALQNVQKYAQASCATVRLRESGGALGFEVEDDGCGFDVEHAKKGSGLTNIGDRLDALGGDLDVHSEPARGTRLVGSLPTIASTLAAVPASGSTLEAVPASR